MKKCVKFEECGREVYYEPSGLCLAHEKARRGEDVDVPKPAKKRAARKRPAPKKAAARKTTEAPTQTSQTDPETRA